MCIHLSTTYHVFILLHVIPYVCNVCISITSLCYTYLLLYMFLALHVPLVSLAARFQSARKLLPVTQKSMTTPRLEPPTIRPPSLPPQASPLTARPSAHVNTAGDKIRGSNLALDTIFSEEPHGVSGTATTIASSISTATTTSAKKAGVSGNKKNVAAKQTTKKRKV